MGFNRENEWDNHKKPEKGIVIYEGIVSNHQKCDFTQRLGNLGVFDKMVDLIQTFWESWAVCRERPIKVRLEAY